MALIKHRFKLKDGATKESSSWYYRFSFRGKTHFGSTETSNKTLAGQVEAKKRRELIERDELGIVSSISLKQALDNYLDVVRYSGEFNNIKTYISKILGKKRDTRVNAIEERFIEIHGFKADRNFDSISMADMQQLVSNRRKEGNSNATILVELSTFCQAIKLNHKLGNPVPQIDFKALKRDNQIKPAKGKLRYLTSAEETKLLTELHPDSVVKDVAGMSAQAIKDDRRDAYDLVVLLLDTGARYSEIAELKWKDVDLRKNEINLYRAKVKNGSVLQMTKRVHQVLTRRSDEKKQKREFIFEANDGSARKYAPKSFNSACRRAGIEGVTLHTLRHTFASRLAQSGMSLHEVQSLLGHASITTTQIYAHLVPNQASSKAVSMLDNFGRGE